MLAVAALLVCAGGAAPAWADEPGDPLIAADEVVTTLGSTGSSPTVDGPFDLVVNISGAGASAITVTPNLPSWSYFPTAPDQVVPGGTCTDTCRLTWRIDPATQATPWYEGLRHISLSAVMDDRSLTTYGTSVYYRPAVSSTWSDVAADPTANTPGYAVGMVDTGGEVTFSGMRSRSPGEQVDVFVLPKAGYDGASNELGGVPLARATGTWGEEPATGYVTGRVHLDTSGLPEGSYRLVAQAHDDAGHYSYSTPTPLAVRHSPVFGVEVAGTGQVATGRSIGARLYLQNPRVDATTPGTVRLTVGGVSTTLEAGYFDWYVPKVWEVPTERVIEVPTTGLPLGRNQVGVEVLGSDGRTIASTTTSIDVVDFHDTVTIPALVVGRNAALHLKATAPAGTTLLQCTFILYGPERGLGSYTMCPGPNATSVDATTYLRPEVAGTTTLREEILVNDDVPGPLRDFPVTVYANRTGTLAAPSKATYATTQSATVTVKDEKRLGTLSAAGAGVTVTLQRKRAGTTTWATIGSAVTASTGVATVKYANTASGRLRAVVAGAVPATTVTTAERAVTSVSAVTWSSLPTSARSGYTVTAAGYAKPYEKGATVRFQARRYGSTSWTTFGSGTVGTSGYAKATARLYSRGTWEVRMQRVGTTTQATGYSSIRRIKVY